MLHKYTIYCFNLTTAEVVTQQRCARCAKVAEDSFRRKLRRNEFLERGMRYIIQVYDGWEPFNGPTPDVDYRFVKVAR